MDKDKAVLVTSYSDAQELVVRIKSFGIDAILFHSFVLALNWLSETKEELDYILARQGESIDGILGFDFLGMVRTGCSFYSALRQEQIDGLREEITRKVAKKYGNIPLICFDALACQSQMTRLQGIYTCRELTQRSFQRAPAYARFHGYGYST